MNQTDKEIINHYNNIIEFCKLLNNKYGAVFYFNEINQSPKKHIEDLKIVYDTYRLQVNYLQNNIGKPFVKNNWNSVYGFIKNNIKEIKQYLLDFKIDELNNISYDFTQLHKERDKDLFKIIKIHALLGDN